MVEPIGYTTNQVVNDIYNTFTNQPESLQIRTLGLIIWAIGALFDNAFLFLAGLLITTAATILLVSEVIQGSGKRSILPKVLMINSVNALINEYLYTGGLFHAGPETYEIAGITLDIAEITSYVLVGFVIAWLATRFLSVELLSTNLSALQYTLLFVAGLAKGYILLVLLDSVGADTEFFGEYPGILITALMVSPLFRGLYSSTFKVVSSKVMVFDGISLPMKSMRSDILQNLVITWIITRFNTTLRTNMDGVLGIQFIALIFFIWLELTESRRFSENPLKGTSIGSMMTAFDQLSGQNTMDFGLIPEKFHALEVSENVKLNIDQNTLLIPVSETKEFATLLVTGTADGIIKREKFIDEFTMDGVTSIVVPTKEYLKLKQNTVSQLIQDIDVSKFGMMDLMTLETHLMDLSNAVSGWGKRVKGELTRFSTSSIIISEKEGQTFVDLFGVLNVIESTKTTSLPAFTKVKIANFLNVLDTKSLTMVKLFGMNIIDQKNFTFVDIPGLLTVFDSKEGTLVKVMGLKIGENMDINALDSIRSKMLQSTENIDRIFDMTLEKSLADPELIPMFNLSKEGEFHPLLVSKGSVITDINQINGAVNPPFLQPAQTSSPKLPEAKQTESSDEEDFEIIE